MTDVTNDDAILIEKKRKAAELLDGSEDGTDEDENGKGKDIAKDDTDEDENGKGKDITQDDTPMAEVETDSAAKITTPSKTQAGTKRTSTRGRPIGSGSKKGCSPPTYYFCSLIIF